MIVGGTTLGAYPVDDGGGSTPAPGATPVATPWGQFLTPGGVPNGYANFPELAQSATALAQGQPAAKAQILTQASAIALAASPIPVAGWVISLGSLIVGTVLGALGIRGTTQHLTTPQAQDQANKWIAANIQPVWNALPPDGKKQMYALVGNWIAGMWRTYADEWGGLIRREGAQFFPWPDGHVAGGQSLIDQGNYAAPWQEVYNSAFFFFFRILAQSDAVHLQDFTYVAFNGFYENDVLKPLNAYMVQKYNETIQQFVAAGGDASSIPSSSNTGLLLAGGGLLGLLLLANPKKAA